MFLNLGAVDKRACGLSSVKVGEVRQYRQRLAERERLATRRV